MGDEAGLKPSPEWTTGRVWEEPRPALGRAERRRPEGACAQAGPGRRAPWGNQEVAHQLGSLDSEADGHGARERGEAQAVAAARASMACSSGLLAN